jgi:hypothetical protein
MWRGEKVHVAISGFFNGYQGMDSITTFRQPYFGPPPDSLRTLFNIAHAAIEAIPPTLGSLGIPNALSWSKHPFTEADIDSTITKSNDGLLVTFSRHDMPGAPIASFDQAYALKLPSGLRISFGAEKNASDFTITGYLANATAPILESGLYGDPWRILLMAMPRRDTETGEIWTSALPSYPPDLEPRLPNPVVPRNAVRSLCYTETDRPKEMQRLLKFGRDSAWPLSVSVASTLDGSNSVTVTYSIDYEECDSSRAWFTAKFLAAAQEDQVLGLPAIYRPTATWTLKLRKEDASFRGILYEDGASTPEDDGCPCYLVYGQKATMKLRCETIEVADRALTCLYGSSPEMTEQVHTSEWAMVASIGGRIPEKHRLVQVDPIDDPDAYNVEIQNLAKASQAYDRGLERFIGKFDSSTTMTATMAI